MKTICAWSIHGFRSLVVIGGGDSRESRQRIYFYSETECMLPLLKDQTAITHYLPCNMGGPVWNIDMDMLHH